MYLKLPIRSFLPPGGKNEIVYVVFSVITREKREKEGEEGERGRREGRRGRRRGWVFYITCVSCYIFNTFYVSLVVCVFSITCVLCDWYVLNSRCLVPSLREETL